MSLVPFYYLSPLVFDRSIVLAAKYFPFAIICVLSSVNFTSMISRDLINSSFAKAVGVYYAFCFLSIWNSDSMLSDVSKLIYYFLSGPWIAFLIGCTFSKTNQLRLIIRTIVLTAALISLYDVWCYWNWKDPLWATGLFESGYGLVHLERPASPLGNPLYAATYLCMALPLVFFYTKSFERLRNNKLASLLTTLLWLGIGVTLSRVALISVMVSLISVSFFLQKTGFTRFIVKYSVTVVLAVFVMSMGSDLLKDRMLRFFGTTSIRAKELVYSSESQSYRLSQYKRTLDVVRERPFLGVGFGNSIDDFKKSIEDNLHTRKEGSLTTENMFLNILCETGILGFFSFLCLMFYLMRHVKLVSKNSSSLQTELQLSLIASCFIALLVNMMAWDSLNQPTVRMFFWMLIGMTHVFKKQINYDTTIYR